MRKLAYYSEKENNFHEKSYSEEAECKHDFAILKRANVPFLYSADCAGGTEMKSYGLGFGALIPITELPENIWKIVDNELNEADEGDYGGKREFYYKVYESENWYGLWIDCGEDDCENEVIFQLFITKDGVNILYI